MPTSQTNVRTALIGYGLAGSVFHAPLIHYTAGMQLAAVVTGNPERQQAARQAYPQAKILADAAQIWQDPADFDLVVVATPNDTHAPLAKLAMQRGIAVVVDKPFAISSAQAEELLDVQNKTGALLSVFQNRRWDCDFLTIKELIETDRVGPVTRIESRFERYRPHPKPGGWRETTEASAGGGLLFDLGSHLIDQVISLFGDPCSVYAEVKARRAGVRSDDDTFVALQFPNGVCAHLWVSMLSKVPGPRFRLLGTRGIYEKFGLDPQEEALKNGLRPGHQMWGTEKEQHSGNLTTTIGDLEFSGTITSKKGCYEKFYEGMRDAITSGAEVPVRPSDAAKALRVIEAARQSSLAQSAVAV
ncbi:MAG TPA: Gfo/Idh/MocA family oxidoreductase [Trichormus sp.]|jgi:predicted dehydrogenase